jgi:hypothetical protein
MSVGHTQEKLSAINARTNKEVALANNESYLNLNPDWQREFEQWDTRKYTHFIEAMLIGQVVNPIWTIDNDVDECEDVLDGMHRLTHALLFLQNKLALGSEFDVLDPVKYKGKKFKELDFSDQQKIRNYNFHINRLDSTYNEDERRRQMWEKLNCCSKPLKQYELDKMTFINYYNLIKPFATEIKSTFINPKDSSKQAQTEADFLPLMALTVKDVPSFSSQANLTQKWQKATLGNTKAEIDAYIEANKDDILRVGKLIVKYTKAFEEHGLMDELEEEGKKSDLTLPARIIVSRTVAYISRPEIFSRHVETLVAEFREKVLKEIRDNNLGCTQKNAPFQRKIINTVDGVLLEVLNESIEPRLFSKTDIERKRCDQNQVCPLCHKEMKVKQQVEGDHILAWAAGGKTTYDNLQVVHKICHRKKKEAPAE